MRQFGGRRVRGKSPGAPTFYCERIDVYRMEETSLRRCDTHTPPFSGLSSVPDHIKVIDPDTKNGSPVSYL